MNNYDLEYVVRLLNKHSITVFGYYAFYRNNISFNINTSIELTKNQEDLIKSFFNKHSDTLIKQPYFFIRKNKVTKEDLISSYFDDFK